MKRLAARLLVLMLLPLQLALAPLNHNELEVMLDALVVPAMRSSEVAGAVVAVTQHDQVVFQKGYGYSDLARRQPVDPEQTLFRIGSITKLFIWTAIMQLEEEGKLQLDVDINEYLTSLEVPQTFREPITLRHLMTHSAGFDDRIIGLFSHDPASVRPLAQLLRDELPSRVREPGAVAVYSNHGAALAGLVIEDLTGMTWYEYVELNILEPLRMRSTTGLQPPPETLKPRLAKGYDRVDGRFREAPDEYVPLGAAGGMSASALDMTRFARMHLNEGVFEGARILQSHGARVLKEPAYRQSPAMNSILHGFLEFSREGFFIYGHGGATVHFFSELALIPEEKLSLFVATNSRRGGEVVTTVVEGFLDRFCRRPAADYVAEPREILNVGAITGEWTYYRHPLTTPDKLLRVLQPMTVSFATPSLIRITGLDESPTYWQQVTKGLFHNRETRRRVEFDLSADPPQLLNGSVLEAWYKLEGFDALHVQLPLLLLCLPLLLWALVVWPLRFWRGEQLQGPLLQVRLAGCSLGLMVLAVSILLAMIGEDILFGMTRPLQAILWLSWGVPLTTTWLAVAVVRRWREPASWRARGFELALCLAGVWLSWLLWYWSLYGPYGFKLLAPRDWQWWLTSGW